MDWDIDFSKTYVNFFKKEGAVVIKNHLANLVNSTLHDRSCIQETFDLSLSAPNFIGAYLDRKKKNLDNTWIVKPVSMARSMDTWVTNNAEQILRLMETGPKIAQKYIERPLTFGGRKIDLRYVVVVKSLLPLEVYLTKEFYIRFGNNQFTMAESTFQEYETHFTVMNYGNEMTNMRCEPFMEKFDEEYKERGVKFSEIQPKINKAIADIFVAFQIKHGKEIEALGNLDKSRGLYGVDVMVDQDLEAKVLEVTFAPDMERFGWFQPQGWNEVFGCLFFNEESGVIKIV